MARSAAAADAEMDRCRRINREMDRLDADMDDIINIRSVVGKVAERLREVNRRLDRAGSSTGHHRR